MKLLKKYSINSLFKLLGLFIFMNFLAAEGVMAQSKVYPIPGTDTYTYTYTVPAGVTKIRVHVWGAGGAGGRRSSIGAGGGGGGGGYSFKELEVTQGATLNIKVGKGGVSDGGIDGEESWVAMNGNNKVLAKGGNGVENNTNEGADGGDFNDGIGDIRFNGGNGANRSGAIFSGGGGGAGGYYQSGSDADGQNGGLAGYGGGNGGNGKYANSIGDSGANPGGGGGGGRNTIGGRVGGSGGNGQVIIEYSWGSGSRDLYPPSGAKGNRATFKGKTVADAAFPFMEHPVHYVYAKTGEVIAMAHSEVGYGSGSIKIYGPNGDEKIFIGGNPSNANGRILNRTAEIMGPRSYEVRGTASENKYRAVYHKAQTAGIYKVVFTPPGIGTQTSDPATATFKATENWTAAGSRSKNSAFIVAWDITVFNNESANAIPQVGRVYSNVLNMDLHDAGVLPENGFYGKLFVQTNDGYTYLVDHNGNNGWGFTFFVNSKGFYDENTKEPIYNSLNLIGASATTIYPIIHSPLKPDTETEITHKMFYAQPGDLPEISVGAVPGDSTWLKKEPVVPEIKELKVIGAEGTENRFFEKGAYIQFKADAGGGYIIEIEGTDFHRTLEGTAREGLNKVFWDGKDNTGAFIGWGTHENINVSAKIRAAEVHFPFFDMELNINGLIVELLNGSGGQGNPDRYDVFWNDTDIPDRNNGARSAPPNASQFEIPQGTSSLVNGHKWGEGAEGTGDAFGDDMGMDTWTFIEGEEVTINQSFQVLKSDLYSGVKYTIEGDDTLETAEEGNEIEFKFTVGNKESTNDLPILSKFTFTVPPGVDVTTDVSTIVSEVTCGNGNVTEEVAISYDETTQTFSGTLSIPGGCSIVYTVAGVINSTFGSMIAESTVLRPADVYDPDASNSNLNMGPVNPHFECYNNNKCYDNPNCDIADNILTENTTSCNNIDEKRFMILPTCAEDVLYFEDFSRGQFAVNSGRTNWVDRKSISLDEYGAITYDSEGNVIRNGTIGGATPIYIFAPGIEDSGYPVANTSHSETASVARIKNGYYSVNPPGYVQMGIPETDSWHEGVWDPNAVSNDSNDPDSNYDWTNAWDQPNAPRDMSGAVNGSAFLVRGTASTSQSIKPFYEITPGILDVTAIYTLDLYSYVTYHDKDYMLMDVIDVETGQIYVSVPLKYPGGGVPPGANPVGFSLGWVPLSASFSFADSECDITNRELKIAIRGSQDRSLESGMGFGHTLIDNIAFSKRSAATEGETCYIDPVDITCLETCFTTSDDIQGYNRTTNEPNTEYTVQGTGDGAAIDIHGFDAETINIIINEAPIFGAGVAGINWNNLHFKSVDDNYTTWGQNGNAVPSAFLVQNFDTGVRLDNALPMLQILIDDFGNINFVGRRSLNASLEEMVLLNNSTEVILDPIGWFDNIGVENKIKIDLPIAQFFIYGKNKKEICDTCVVEKLGVFDDRNNDGYAQAGEIIKYTITVKNSGDLAISDLVVIDPIFNENISINSTTHLPEHPSLDVELAGDQNGNGILDINETWVFTVNYPITNDNIFKTKGVYNQAEVNGTGSISVLTETLIQIDGVMSIDTTPAESRGDNWSPIEYDYSEEHNFVPLKGANFRRTNPSLPSRTKKESRQ